MKKSTYLPTLLIAGTTVLFSCSKTDLTPENPSVEPKKTDNCQLTSFRFGTTGSQYVLQRQYDAAGNLKQITAGVYQGGAISKTITLDAHWASGSLALITAGTTTDTVLFVALNAQGKPVSATPGNAPIHDFLPTTFEYSNNRLSAIKFELAGTVRTSRFQYDNKDNLVSMIDDPLSNEIPAHVEFTYNNTKADNQVYFDEPRIFSTNTFSLMEFAGLLPELEPTRLRTGVKVFWQNNYKVYDVQLTNHQLNNGKLVSYDVVHNGSSTGIPYYTEWSCGSDVN